MVGAYNATPQATTGKSPAELLHGKRMRTRLDVMGRQKLSGTDDGAVRRQVEERQLAQKRYADGRRAAADGQFRTGQWVKTRKPQPRKGENRYNEPVMIRRQLGTHTFETSDGRVWHQNQMVKGEPAPEGNQRTQQPTQSAAVYPILFGNISWQEEEEEEAESHENEKPEQEETHQDNGDHDTVVAPTPEAGSEPTDGENETSQMDISRQTNQTSYMDLDMSGVEALPEEETPEEWTTPGESRTATESNRQRKRTADEDKTPQIMLRKQPKRIIKKPRYLEDYV